jgi:hypothetical protein
VDNLQAIESPFYCTPYEVEGLSFTTCLKRQLKAQQPTGKGFCKNMGQPLYTLCRDCLQGRNVMEFAKINGIEMPKIRGRKQALDNIISPAARVFEHRGTRYYVANYGGVE